MYFGKLEFRKKNVYELHGLFNNRPSFFSLERRKKEKSVSCTHKKKLQIIEITLTDIPSIVKCV